MKIGLFDSGLGGLNVLNKFRQVLPQYDYVYFGDHAHAPLGDKNSQAIRRLTIQGVKFLKNQGAGLIILACNTATATSLRFLQQKFIPQNHWKTKILGIIRPTTELIVQKNCQRVGLMATTATINSKVFGQEIEKLSGQTEILPLACPELVPLIENNFADINKIKPILQKYCRFFKDKNIDLLILGCTHYSLLQPQLKKLLPNIEIIAEEDIAAKRLKDYLGHHQKLTKQLNKNSTCQALFSIPDNQDVEKYKKLAAKIAPSCQITWRHP